MRQIRTHVIDDLFGIRHSVLLQVEDRLCRIQVIPTSTGTPELRLLQFVGESPQAEPLAYLELFEVEGGRGVFRLDRPHGQIPELVAAPAPAAA